MRSAASVALFLVAALARAADGSTVYVDDGAPPGGNGSSWSAAYRFLEDALAAAAPGSGISEIRVAQGTYTPDRTSASPSGTGDRGALFQLLDGVSIVGGYAGLGAPDPDARDVLLHPSILSADLAANDLDVSGQCCGLLADPGCANQACRTEVCTEWWNGCCSSPTYWSKLCSVAGWSLCDLCGPATRAENGFHVVGGSDTGASAVLDGFTIRAGHADGQSPDNRGGGLYIDGGSPTLIACTFLECSAAQGGAIFNAGGNPVLSGCTFQENLTADPFVRENGGAIYNLDSDPQLTNCTFFGNFAKWGAAIYNKNSSPTLTGCTFDQNFADLGGAGLANEFGSNAVLSGCTFTENWANAQSGGAITSDGSSHLTVTGCNFFDNFGVSTGGISSDQGNHSLVQDCVFQGNTTGSPSYGSAIGGGALTVVHCTFIDNGNGTVGPRYESGLMQIEDCTFITGVVAINVVQARMHATNCTFTNFQSTVQTQYDESESVLTDCTISNGINGVYASGAKTTLVHCLISNLSDRAVTLTSGARATLVNCALSGNHLAIRPFSSANVVTLVNCQLINNAQVAFFNATGSTLDFRGCTLYNNPQGFQWSVLGSGVFLRNSIVWQTPIMAGGNVYAVYSDIQGGWPGTGNINADPLFTNPAVEDFHLAPGSPCIEAGHNWLMPQDEWDLDGDGDLAELAPLDLGRGPRFTDSPTAIDTGCGVGAVIDMGALESPGAVADPVVYLDMTGDGVVDGDDLQALLDQFGPCQLPCCLGDLDLDGDVDNNDLCIFTRPPCPGDLDGNGAVAVGDMLALLAAWNTHPIGPPDLNCDGTVNVSDLLALFSDWGACP